jgi:glutamate racemase
MSKAQQPIGIFDSGRGGLTVLAECLKKLPHENYIYFGDLARVPYGGRDSAEILQINFEILDFFKAQGVKAVLMACNTSSAIALDEAVKKFDFPIWGLINPVCSAAVDLTQNQKIAVLGTQATINSGAYQKTLKGINPRIEVLALGCPEFVPIIENGKIDELETKLILKKYLSQVEQFGADILIHGCSHFPFLENAMKMLLTKPITFLDPAVYLVRQTSKLLDLQDLLSVAASGSVRYFCTQNTANGLEVIQNEAIFKDFLKKL